MVMAEETPTRRVLPARSRRESTRRASSPSSKPATPAVKTPATPATDDSKSRKRPEKRIKTVHVSTPSRSASTPTSIGDEILPTKVTSTRPLPASTDKQPEGVSNKHFQSVADSAILAASLHRSRMQWLCDGILTKYWTKPIKRKKVVEEPPNNPDVKSMQKLGNATITIEPHTFDAVFYVVRESQVLPLPAYRPPIQQTPKPNSASPALAPTQPNVHAPTVSSVPTASATPASKPTPTPATPAPSSNRPPTPPGGAKTTDPVIQMLASRAATDVHLKDLMKVVATSKATPDQLREFQAHIDEFNAIVKRQEAEKEAKAKLAASTPYRNSPLNPTPHFAAFPMQPRQEAIKHVVIEFTSPPAAGQAASTDRWLFPEHTVLDTQYGGTEMTCSFFAERKGADILASMKDLTSEEMQSISTKWRKDTEYYQPITMVVKAAQHRTIETIARSAKPLSEVQKYMQEVMEKKTRAPQDFLVHRLPREKADNSVDFVDSAVELSGEDDELKDFYPM
ncbi:hypothetical protein PMZ80_004315 [Knufia obscura]|uniref:SWR1-complex protein 3 domain-containing protein n=2 Tax=Knufia TaxID=430999 RepID=A0AAN8EL25_9EURO|nr:hypothetical protein PMZ80_004315 [Knufia obscura]KAK5949186.1 hypothetical protein OHC33_009727 [Knufia fluminis]